MSYAIQWLRSLIFTVCAYIMMGVLGIAPGLDNVGDQPVDVLLTLRLEVAILAIGRCTG